MPITFENQVKRIVGRLGYDVRPLAPRDLRRKVSHPIEAAYLAELRPCLVDVPLSWCRSFYGLPFNMHHPFVRTARAYIDGKVSSYKGSPLEVYYSHFQPKHAEDLFVLPPPPPTWLAEVPPFAFVWPWESEPVHARIPKRLARIENENEVRGARLPMSHGYSSYGPVSPEKGNIEFLATARLVDSIRQSGYVRRDELDGDIRAIPLIDKKCSVRYLIRWGQHRASVLAALDFEQLPVVINFRRPVRADEAEYWPHVKSGLFTHAQALNLFDQIFAGCPSSKAIPSGWLGDNATGSQSRALAPHL
jgi:hypothetical protein